MTLNSILYIFRIIPDKDAIGSDTLSIKLIEIFHIIKYLIGILFHTSRTGHANIRVQ
jgi:hypothetical protein